MFYSKNFPPSKHSSLVCPVADADDVTDEDDVTDADAVTDEKVLKDG
jgi:hypothetical protein